MEEPARLMRAWPGLRDAAKPCCQPCGQCQRCKAARKKKHGLLPEKQGEAAKWSRASAGSRGPKPAVSKNGYNYQAHAMAMVDPATGWLEHAQLCEDAPAAKRCQEILGTAWLARYPRPKEAGLGNGSELQKELRGLRKSAGAKPKASLPQSPQPNAVLGRAR